MSDQKSPWKKTVRKETALFLWLLLIGLFLLPVAIYAVGRLVFGDYGGTGFPAFYGMLHSDLRAGEPAVWFLVLSPYLAWQATRLTYHTFRKSGGR